MPTETKAKHTPGKWYKSALMIRGAEPQHGDVHPLIAIAHVDVQFSLEEADANALLISQAPAMLAALERALPTLERQYADTGALAYRNIMEQARAAIRAAKGEV